MSWQNISSWNLIDPAPGVELSQIANVSQRAEALMVRNRAAPLLASGFVNVAGAIDMMAGLQYHYENFMRIWAIYEGVFRSPRGLDHEIVAYFNRLGQFHAFSQSEFVKQAIPDVSPYISTITSFMIFRMKHSAHRSLDDPRKGETEEGRLAHARSLTSLFGYLSTPKPGAVIPKQPEPDAEGNISGELYENYLAEIHPLYDRTYQTFDEKLNKHIQFTLSKEHPILMSEAYSVIKSVVDHR